MKYQVSIIETKTYSIEVSAKNEDEASTKACKIFEDNPDKFELTDADWQVEDVDEEG